MDRPPGLAREIWDLSGNISDQKPLVN